MALTLTLTPTPSLTQAAAQEAARLDLSTDEIGQFFHARMLQSLGRYSEYIKY